MPAEFEITDSVPAYREARDISFFNAKIRVRYSGSCTLRFFAQFSQTWQFSQCRHCGLCQKSARCVNCRAGSRVSAAGRHLLLRGEKEMLKINSFAVIGGDKRAQYMAGYLHDCGYKINTYDASFDCSVRYNLLDECLEQSDAVILPLPVTKDDKTIYCDSSKDSIELEHILTEKLKNKVVFLGKATSIVENFMKKNHVEYYDYFKMEDMTLKNAIATAEGAVAIAVNNKSTTIYDSDCLVAGYGRIGKAIVKILRGMGARVTVAARKSSDRVLIKFEGATPIDYEQLKEAHHFDVIFNTVPHLVFTKPELQYLNKDALIIDLASFPGGVDFHQAKSLGIENITASAIPSKFSPKSAGEFIAQSIINTIKEDV